MQLALCSAFRGGSPSRLADAQLALGTQLQPTPTVFTHVDAAHDAVITQLHCNAVLWQGIPLTACVMFVSWNCSCRGSSHSSSCIRLKHKFFDTNAFSSYTMCLDAGGLSLAGHGFGGFSALIYSWTAVTAHGAKSLYMHRKRKATRQSHS